MTTLRAVLWDFGGVILSSPFDAFNRYEAENGLKKDFIRSVNTRNPDGNAWAKFERSEVDSDAFGALFAAESRALGHEIDGREILPLLAGEIRPRMVQALKTVKTRYKTACLTNNVRRGHGAGHGPGMSRTPEQAAAVAAVMALFDCVVESSKVGARKPEPAFYIRACEALGIRPEEAEFLDDLGINLKPAAAMGMKTIKVVDPDSALRELGAITGLAL
jgi:putative hydrolase of the HAD superfamily